MYLATAGERLRLHGTDDYKRSLEYKPRYDGKRGIALDVSWSPDGSYFGAACDGWPKIEIMMLDSGDADINLFRCLNVENPTSIAFSKLGDGQLAVGNKEGIVSVFDCKSKDDPVLKFQSCKHKVTSLDFSSSGSAIAAGTTAGEVYILGLKSGKPLDRRDLNWRQAITSVKYHHSRKGIVAAGCNHGSVTLWDVNLGIVEKQFMCHEAPCKGVVFSPNNITFMASVGYDFVLNFFDIRTKNIIFKSSIPEAGSSIDIHSDGSTIAVGSLSGGVYIYDARKMSSPKENFSSLKGSINNLAFQSSLMVKKKRSKAPPTSLKKQIFKPVDSRREMSGSSNSSCEDVLFSPIMGIQEPEKKVFKENVQTSLFDESCISSIVPAEGAQTGNLLSDDSVFSFSPSEAPSSAEKVQFNRFRPLFPANEGTMSSEKMNGVSHHANNEATPIGSFSSGLGTQDSRNKSPERLLRVSQAENLPEHIAVEYLSFNNLMKCSDVSPGHKAIPMEDSRKSPRSSKLKTPMKTPRLLDLPTLSARKLGDGRGDSVPSENCNLLSFLEPLSPVLNSTRNDEVTSAMPITPTKSEKSMVKILISSPCSNLMESKEEVKSSVDVEDLSDREILDILDKYSISKRVEDASKASLSFDESEIEDIKEATPLSKPSEVKKVSNEIQEAKEEEREAPESLLEMKKYMDEMYKDMCYELKKAMSTMHIFNVSAHAKQEILMQKILSELKKEKVDKCVGTDGCFY